MTDKNEIVANKIRKAFDGVKLGNGIGLLQGNGLDDYADDLTLAKYRSQDEADDWSKIDIEKLNCYSAALSFMDAEGMRFHLPAYMIAHLQGGLRVADIVFHLCYVSKNAESRFDLLNTEQRIAVREFLQLRLLSGPKDNPQGAMIQNAFDQYWQD